MVILTPTGPSGHKSEPKTFTGRVRRRLPLSEDEDQNNTDGSSLDANTSDVTVATVKEEKS